MSTQLIICLVIFALTCIGYMTGVWSLGTVAMASLVALSLTGCLAPSEALAYFSNNNVIMIGAMRYWQRVLTALNSVPTLQLAFPKWQKEVFLRFC